MTVKRDRGDLSSPVTVMHHRGQQFPPWSPHWSERLWSDTSPENFPNASSSHLGGSQTCVLVV